MKYKFDSDGIEEGYEGRTVVKYNTNEDHEDAGYFAFECYDSDDECEAEFLMDRERAYALARFIVETYCATVGK